VLIAGAGAGRGAQAGGAVLQAGRAAAKPLLLACTAIEWRRRDGVRPGQGGKLKLFISGISWETINDGQEAERALLCLRRGTILVTIAGACTRGAGTSFAASGTSFSIYIWHLFQYRNFNNWLSVMNFISRLLFKELGALKFRLWDVKQELPFCQPFVCTISTSRQLEAKRDLVAGVVYGTDFFTKRKIQDSRGILIGQIVHHRCRLLLLTAPLVHVSHLRQGSCASAAAIGRSRRSLVVKELQGCRWLGPLSKWSMTSVNLGTFQDGDLLPNTQTTMAKKGQYVKSQETGTALDRASAEQLKMSSPILPPPKLHTQEKKRKKILFRSKVRVVCAFIELSPFLRQLNYISFDYVFGLQGLVDMNKPPEMISGNMKFKEIQFQKLQRLLDGCHPDFDNDHLCFVNNHDLLLEMSTPSADLHLLPETGVENIRTPKSLHAELKRELSKLNTVLKLQDNVLFLANQFIEYLLHNHLVVREPRSILHAFNIAL
ncbi:hypothetical protein ACJX0J_034061, partial [Zea mays]